MSAIDLKPKETIRRKINYFLFNYEVKRKHSFLLCRPLKLIIEPTNRCNLACIYCARNYWDKSLNPIGDISFELSRKLFILFPYAERVRITGHGEPLLSEMFWVLLKKSAEAGCITEASTNSTTLTDEVMHKIIEYGLSTLLISIDGVKDETMHKIRKITFSSIKEKIIKIQKIKRNLNSQFPTIEPSWTLMVQNIAELPELIKMCPTLGIHKIVTNHLRVWSPDLAYQSLHLHPDLMKKYFEIAALEAEKNHIQLTLPPMRIEKKECLQPFDTFMVRWHGEVRACCYANFTNKNHTFAVGNLNQKSPLKIWNSREYREARETCAGKRPLNIFCKFCSDYCGNLLEYLKEKDSSAQ